MRTPLLPTADDLVMPRPGDGSGSTGRRTFAKGHGTENDFVLLVDADDRDPLSADQVVALCDRRAGIGADGVLRAVRAEHAESWTSQADDPVGLWFMDYRNADGSIAEMCGNGVRVFVRHLVELGLVEPDAEGGVPVATRAGLRATWLLADGRVRVAMGAVVVGDRDISVSVDGSGSFPAQRASVGNPHAVVLLPDDVELTDLDLTQAPVWSPAAAFPDGVNQEFVVRRGPRHIAMRVYERGSAETRSCGTGTCAVAAVVAAQDGETGRGVRYTVDVAGGRVEVELGVEDTFLTGPAVVLAHGTVDI